MAIPPSQTPALICAITAITSCSIIGVYGSMVTGFLNGFFDAISASATHPNPSLRYIPGGPSPLKTHYTGIRAVDEQVLVLVAFFASILNGKQGWNITLSYWYLMLQLVAAWMLLVIEGFRVGNRGRLVSWTGTIGMVFQNISYTITVPICLIVHLLNSPLASEPKPSDILAPITKARFVPVCSLLAFILPAIGMSFPSPSFVPATVHYSIIAFWQCFPMWQSILQWAVGSDSISKPPGSKPSPYISSISSTYFIIIALCVSAQLSLILVALIPASAVPTSWAPIFKDVNICNAFLPVSLFSPPTVDPEAVPIPDAMAPLAHQFLQYDVYSGNTAMFIWALYISRHTAMRAGLAQMAIKLVAWWFIGGPIAAAAVLIWERDVHALRSLTADEKEKSQ